MVELNLHDLFLMNIFQGQWKVDALQQRWVLENVRQVKWNITNRTKVLALFKERDTMYMVGMEWNLYYELFPEINKIISNK